MTFVKMHILLYDFFQQYLRPMSESEISLSATFRGLGGGSVQPGLQVCVSLAVLELNLYTRIHRNPPVSASPVPPPPPSAYRVLLKITYQCTKETVCLCTPP